MTQTRNSGSRFWALLAAVVLLALWTGNAPAQAQGTKKLVDINSADITTLETLPGIGPATAQKIIDGRPYKSPADLQKVKGLSKSKVDALKDQIVFGPTATAATTAKPSMAAPVAQGQAPKTPVDVNSADLATLETLPGIGPATAQKIIDGRPYKSLADLQKVKGLSKSKVDALKDQIVFGSPATATTAKPSKAAPVAQGQAPKTPVDVNSADLATLEMLPGIGPATAQKIIDGRPYKSLADLQKVKGLSKSKVDALKDQVVFGPPAVATTAQPSQTGKAEGAKSPPATASTAVGEKGTKAATPTPTGHATGTLAPGQKININTATPEELDSLPGIGPAKAKAIIDYRTQNGPFKTIDDIQKVKGIKEGEFSKIKDSIKVSD